MSSDLVLIADANLGRARRVATALEAAGRPCAVAPHGAGALEIALSEQPRVIVTHVDLPLVEPGKLAEILRANPRTRAARFLFLGADGGRDATLGGVGDECLPADAETNDIQDAIEELLDRQARIEALEERASYEREFEGSLSELRPAELLQMLNVRRSTGRLTLTPELEDGSTPDGWILVSEGEIHAAGAGAAEAEKALFRMLDWGLGDFHFEPTEIDRPATIKAPTRSVLAEGLRQLDEWNRLAPKLPPLESPVKLCVERGELPTTVHPLTQSVLGQLEDADRVGDVVDRCPHPDYQVLRTLHTLAERGIVEFGRARIAPPEPVSGQAIFHEAQVRRLRSFAGQGVSREAVPPSCKLLVVGASQGGVELFASLIAKVPGAELAPRFERGQVGRSDLEPIARIDVDGDFGIDLIHVPTAESCAPLWRFAGHRALGTVFLLDAAVGTSAAELAPVSEALGSAPDARTFHVVMLGEGERLSPDDLRDNLSLIDEASLFLLPIEPDKDPSSLLRSLFARIVP
ncbi:MAG: DUF4388 domain-containing protein [bacterium]|nr:DUF4388 domain-containing protein [bacterium]